MSDKPSTASLVITRLRDTAAGAGAFNGTAICSADRELLREAANLIETMQAEAAASGPAEEKPDGE